MGILEEFKAEAIRFVQGKNADGYSWFREFRTKSGQYIFPLYAQDDGVPESYAVLLMSWLHQDVRLPSSNLVMQPLYSERIIQVRFSTKTDLGDFVNMLEYAFGLLLESVPKHLRISPLVGSQ